MIVTFWILFGGGGCLNYLFDDLHVLEPFEYIFGYNYIVPNGFRGKIYRINID
jgi:hypothetical protein